MEISKSTTESIMVRTTWLLFATWKHKHHIKQEGGTITKTQHNIGIWQKQQATSKRLICNNIQTNAKTNTTPKIRTTKNYEHVLVRFENSNNTTEGLIRRALLDKRKTTTNHNCSTKTHPRQKYKKTHKTRIWYNIQTKSKTQSTSNQILRTRNCANWKSKQ